MTHVLVEDRRPALAVQQSGGMYLKMKNPDETKQIQKLFDSHI